MKKIHIVSILLLGLIIQNSNAQISSLRQKIEEVIQVKKADVGVAILGLESNDTLSIKGNTHFPMQSIFKFHIALAVLYQVDRGVFTIDQKIDIQKADLQPLTWSPLRDDYPNGNVKLPLSEILKYTVSKSDNNGCDILLKLLGGVKNVQSFIDSLGITAFSIKANEEEMHRDWNIQFTNWTTPNAAIKLLKLFFDKKVLSKTSSDFLMKIMIETSTGLKRIKGQLPSETQVAHKTGSSGANEQGTTAATNDIGIVTLPNGNHFAIAVFVSNSKESDEVNEKIISDIAKLTWDYFVK
jgi:beta-lactamase class A